MLTFVTWATEKIPGLGPLIEKLNDSIQGTLHRIGRIESVLTVIPLRTSIYFHDVGGEYSDQFFFCSVVTLTRECSHT